MTEKFKKALEEFLKHCAGIRRKRFMLHKFGLPGQFVLPKLVVHDGKSPKYIKIIEIDDKSGRSVFCFIERETGNVLKANSWSSPHPKPRGNIFTPDNYGVEWHGARYLT